MKYFWYKVKFKIGKAIWVQALSEKEAIILAQAKAIRNGWKYDVENVICNRLLGFIPLSTANTEVSYE